MILNGKKFEYGLCPSCNKRRPVYEKDGLCYGCGGHAMPEKKSAYFLTVDWCGKRKRGIFCNKNGCGFKKKIAHTDVEMLKILGPFHLILNPKSELFIIEELEKFNIWRPLAEYQNFFGIASKE